MREIGKSNVSKSNVAPAGLRGGGLACTVSCAEPAPSVAWGLAYGYAPVAPAGLIGREDATIASSSTTTVSYAHLTPVAFCKDDISAKPRRGDRCITNGVAERNRRTQAKRNRRYQQRTYTVEYQQRTYTVEYQQHTYTIEYQQHTYTIRHQKTTQL